MNIRDIFDFIQAYSELLGPMVTALGGYSVKSFALMHKKNHLRKVLAIGKGKVKILIPSRYGELTLRNSNSATDKLIDNFVTEKDMEAAISLKEVIRELGNEVEVTSKITGIGSYNIFCIGGPLSNRNTANYFLNRELFHEITFGIRDSKKISEMNRNNLEDLIHIENANESKESIHLLGEEVFRFDRSKHEHEGYAFIIKLTGKIDFGDAEKGSVHICFGHDSTTSLNAALFLRKSRVIKRLAGRRKHYALLFRCDSEGDIIVTSCKDLTDKLLVNKECSLGNKKEETKATIYDNSKDNEKVTLLSTPNIMPKPTFKGRENILSAIYSNYQAGERVLFLYGMGAIGKTQIAKQYAKDHRGDYDTIIYATYNGSIRTLVLNETPFATEPEIIRYTLSDGSQEKDEDFFKRKLEKLQKVSNEKTLIILDNFDIEEDADLRLLLNGRYHLLITTRCDYSLYYPAIKVTPIDSIDTLIEIFMENYQGCDVTKDDPNLVKLIELVNRHTYTIELLAKHMSNSGQTPSEMITALEEQGIESMDQEVRDSDMQTQAAYKNLLNIFEIFHLSEEERQILMYLSLMPSEGVDEKDFKKWANLRSPKAIRDMENRSWILKDAERLSVHPIIGEVIKKKIPATEDNCSDFISRFAESIGELRSWHFKKIDKDKYGTIAKGLLSIFKEISPKTELLYYTSEVLLSYAVDPKYSVKLAERLYEYYTAKCCRESYHVGRSALRIGWTYAYNTHLPDAVNQALNWLTKADKILSNLELTTTEEIAKLTQTKVNLAKLYLILFEMTKKQEDYLMAKTHAEFCVEYSLNSYHPGDPHYDKLAGAYWQLADVLLAGKELERALESIEKSLAILIPFNTENNNDFMHALSRKAAVLFAMGRAKEAKPLAKKSVIGYAEYFGENHPIIVSMYMLLGDCCDPLAECDEAKAAYDKALNIAEKLYAPGAQQIDKIKEKIAKYL